MEGLAKSAPQPKVETKQVIGKTSGIESMAQAVHPEFYKFFNINPIEGNSENLKTISDWALRDSPSTGVALKKIRDLEIKLGSPAVGETRVSKMYNYIRMTDKLVNKEREAKNELNGIRKKHNAVLAEIKATFKDKVNKINEELKKITDDYNKAKSAYNRTASDRANNMRKEFAIQINELKAMRDAYKGGVK